MIKRIRQLVSVHGRLRVPVESLRDNDNLWAAGLASFAAVQLMLALEEEFEIEFPAPNRAAFASCSSIAAEVIDLSQKRRASSPAEIL